MCLCEQTVTDAFFVVARHLPREQLLPCMAQRLGGDCIQAYDSGFACAQYLDVARRAHLQEAVSERVPVRQALLGLCRLTIAISQWDGFAYGYEFHCALFSCFP